MVINIRKNFWYPETQSFIFELSELSSWDYENPEWLGIVFSRGSFANHLYLRNPDTHTMVRFNHTKTNTDATGEDIYGWNYKSECGKYSLLIIND